MSQYLNSYFSIVNYYSQGQVCTAFNGLTCNAEDPTTGLVHTGFVENCQDGGWTNPTVTVSPFGGVTVKNVGNAPVR